VQIHQYGAVEVRVQLPAGPVALQVSTSYPFDDEVGVTVIEAPSTAFELSLRIPPFARGVASLRVAGEDHPVAGDVATISRVFRPGDLVVLTLPRRVRTIEPDPRIDAVRGCVAFERGPLVLAVESNDLPAGIDVNDLTVLASEAQPSGRGARVRAGLVDGTGRRWPYGSATGQPNAVPLDDEIDLRPYFQWGNRGPSTMRVWLPVSRPRTLDG
jgi:DUF1680 family protein